MTTTTTPPRNNYAAPHTPIASAKRPRSSLDRSSSRNLTSPPMMKKPPTPPPPPPSESMSPMHPPRPFTRDEEETVVEVEETSSWMGKKVDALFSPVLSFLGSSKDDDNDDDVLQEETAHCITDEDVTMEDEAPSVAPAPEVEEEEKEEEHPSNAYVDHELHQDYSSSYEEEEEEFNPYLFIKSLPSYDAVKHLTPTTALPPKHKDAPPISLVLDLDETLVHCTIDAVQDADLIFPVVFHGCEYQVHVRLRPYLFEFLQAIKDKYEVIVFTASQKVYADQLLNRIDPEGKYIQHRMFRESCLAVEGNYLKDLNVLGRDLNKTVLVDNSPHAFGYQVDNGIPIESWFDDKDDSELLKLAGFLDTLHNLNDVKTMVRSKFQTYKLIQEA